MESCHRGVGQARFCSRITWVCVGKLWYSEGLGVGVGVEKRRLRLEKSLEPLRRGVRATTGQSIIEPWLSIHAVELREMVCWTIRWDRTRQLRNERILCCPLDLLSNPRFFLSYAFEFSLGHQCSKTHYYASFIYY
jgi:hypothetical protein